MNSTIHKSSARGQADLGWLKSRHTFSFGHYFDPKRMGFGVLRVLNDDWVSPSKGFDTHPHRDMEIVSIPLKGSLMHKDSEGNEHRIEAGEIQRMSAGTGIFHSEYNGSSTESVNFLQIWIKPRSKGLDPGYEQIRFDESEWANNKKLVVSPNGQNGSLRINQDAYFYRVDLTKGTTLDHTPVAHHLGTYIFVIEGQVSVNGQLLEERDGMAVEAGIDLNISANAHAKLLMIDVPLS